MSKNASKSLYAHCTMIDYQLIFEHFFSNLLNHPSDELNISVLFYLLFPAQIRSLCTLYTVQCTVPLMDYCEQFTEENKY
jgi:hypothetical protein